MQLDFTVEKIEPVTIAAPDALTGSAWMSPYVWRLEGGGHAMLVRVVPPPGAGRVDTGSIWYGTSEDGVHFTLDDSPAIAPGPDANDIGGCEDPTYVADGDRVLVYYTGVDANGATGRLMLAQGPDMRHLTKSGVALASSKTEGNTKEATIDRTSGGKWWLFYEYAHADASRIGLALGDGACGPWHEHPHPFDPREGRWDSWHLSTGPMLTTDKEHPVMFYNGATRDARWRIGWIAFDREYTRVVDRCVEPLIVPPPQPERSMADIAFAASVIAHGDSAILYYSIADARLERAHIRRYAR
ncbi:glycosidase [Sphingosinithalassobacter portus]|uniref:glycoside hydrolase family 130 protein n=1 Tax=Stakelama portus TaxID=2676234 RepID=UPI000D6E673E|nr:glycosidase [Sphingosinithalassobacter portus]